MKNLDKIDWIFFPPVFNNLRDSDSCSWLTEGMFKTAHVLNPKSDSSSHGSFIQIYWIISDLHHLLQSSLLSSIYFTAFQFH